MPPLTTPLPLRQPPTGMVEIEYDDDDDDTMPTSFSHAPLSLARPPKALSAASAGLRQSPLKHKQQQQQHHHHHHHHHHQQRPLVVVSSKQKNKMPPPPCDDSSDDDDDDDEMLVTPAHGTTPAPPHSTPKHRPNDLPTADTHTDAPPSVSTASSTASPTLAPRAHSFCSSLESNSKASAKASAKAAKRQARKQLNKDKRRAEAAQNVPSKTNAAPQPQPWEVALDSLPTFPSPARASRASFESVDAFKVPQDRQLLLECDRPVPSISFDATHNVAAAIVERLVAAFGGWSITFSDPAYRIFITVDKAAALSFKVQDGMVNPVAVVFGDPVCHPDRLEDAIQEFRAFCRAQGWRSAFVGVRDRFVQLADKRHWTTVEFAVEQVVDPVTNEILDGKAGSGATGKRMMTLVRKLAKDNILRMYNPADGVDTVLQVFLQGVYDQCYASKEAAKGDTTAYSTKLHLFDLPHLMTYFYTLGHDGLPNGMAGLMQVGPGKYLLDPVVAAPGAPTGTSDFLTIAAMGYLRRRGVRHMSFGLEPLREVGEIRNMRAPIAADTRLINAASYDAFGFAGKKMLHDKFRPDPARTVRTHLVLGSRNPLTQADAAAAICQATHLKVSPILRRLIWLLQAAQVGKTMEGLLGRLVSSGRLSKGSDVGRPSADNMPAPPPRVVVTDH